MRLTSLENVKLFLGITDADDDTLLGEILEGVSSAIETDLGRPIALGTYSEIFDIDNDYTDEINLKNYPVNSVVALTDNGVLLTHNTHYYWTTYGYIMRLPKSSMLNESGYFTVGARKVEVTYVAGYAEIPSDIQLITKKIVGQVYENREGGSFQHEKIGDYSYSLLETAAVADSFLDRVLKRYRRIW